jgi:hypothetical protein
VNEHEHDSELRSLAQGLGARAAERLDVERTAAAVVRRLREEPVAPPAWWRRPAMLRLAAAFVILAGGGLLARSAFQTTHPAHYVVEDLRGLSADDLRDVLNTLDQTLDLDSTATPGDGLDGLNADQLRAVLRSLEG